MDVSEGKVRRLLGLLRNLRDRMAEMEESCRV